ncbi:MAG: class I SAM-dependent methyltransferase [Thermoleophilaceae bacterium]|nr:class I SAM-dependent methyltransferase [Thermoleophilaceae bacterium]
MEDWTYQEHYDMEDRHWWFRSRRRVIWALIHRAQPPASPRILDAGCGTGRNLMEFRRLGPAEGVDRSRQAVEFCQRRGLNGVREAAIEELPFGSGRFDLIFATDVLEHLPDDGAALAELRRVARPGARLIVTAPAYRWLWSRHDSSWHHYRRYTRPLLRERVESHGWSPAVSTYFYSTMLPPVAVVRTLQRLASSGNGRSDLHLSPGALDRWLELPVRGEAALIKRGVSLPAGVSLGMACIAR